jgi:hypothetical protein
VAARAEAEGWQFRVVGTSSIEHLAAPGWYQPFDVAPLFARVLRSLHARESVTGAHRGA